MLRECKLLYWITMIYDKLDNFDTYAAISEEIRLGLEFLRQVSPVIEFGVYELTPRLKAIVSEYETKEVNENGYEAHLQYIDIQCPIRGLEKVCCLPLEMLNETKPYNKEIDAAFYSTDVKPLEMSIGNGYFAIFFPQDGHMPQLCVDKKEMIKKVTLKVKI